MGANSTEADVAYKHNAHLGEGPVWSEKEGKLYWMDILSGLLMTYDPRIKKNSSMDMGEHAGAVALREKGGFVAILKSGFYFIDPEKEEKTLISDPESDLTDTRFNDGKCDPSGRFWAGTLSYNLDEGAGSLYCLNSDLEVEKRLDNLTIPNGMAWNSKKDKFYFIDSPTGTIFSFDYDDASGSISNRDVVRTLESHEGSPDGMTIDEEDALWVALYAGSKVIRIDPDSGKTLFEVHLPAPHITSCTFGGSELDELYITSARENMSGEDIEKAPLSGSLFKAKVPFKGIPASRFSG